MIESLAIEIEHLWNEYSSMSAFDLLTSEDWKNIRLRSKGIAVKLEIEQFPAIVTRLDREYEKIWDELRKAASCGDMKKLSEEIIVWDAAQEYIVTLRAIADFLPKALEKQKQINSAHNNDTNSKKPLSNNNDERYSIKMQIGSPECHYINQAQILQATGNLGLKITINRLNNKLKKTGRAEHNGQEWLGPVAFYKTRNNNGILSRKESPLYNYRNVFNCFGNMNEIREPFDAYVHVPGKEDQDEAV